jgi:hypothetical protein
MRWPPIARQRLLAAARTSIAVRPVLALLDLRRLDAGQPYGRAPMRSVSPVSACARPSTGMALLSDGSQAMPRSPAPRPTNQAMPATATTARPATAMRGHMPSVAKRGMRPGDARQHRQRRREQHQAGTHRDRVSPSAQCCGSARCPTPARWLRQAPASADVGSLQHDNKRTQGNAEPAHQHQRRRVQLLQQQLASSASGLPALRRQPATPRPARSIARRRTPAADGASAAPASLICWAAACGIVDALAALLTPVMVNAHVLMPFEAFRLFRQPT